MESSLNEDDVRLLKSLRQAERQRLPLMDELLAQQRGRLRKMVQVRMDHRLQGASIPPT